MYKNLYTMTNGLKKKYHRIISVDADKVFDKHSAN